VRLLRGSATLLNGHRLVVTDQLPHASSLPAAIRSCTALLLASVRLIPVTAPENKVRVRRRGGRRRVLLVLVLLAVAAWVGSVAWSDAQIRHPPVDGDAIAVADRFVALLAVGKTKQADRYLHLPGLHSEYARLPGRNNPWRWYRTTVSGHSVTYDFVKRDSSGCRRTELSYDLGKVGGRWRITGSKFVSGGFSTSRDGCA
jgi:hypothetical protein